MFCSVKQLNCFLLLHYKVLHCSKVLHCYKVLRAVARQKQVNCFARYHRIPVVAVAFQCSAYMCTVRDGRPPIFGIGRPSYATHLKRVQTTGSMYGKCLKLGKTITYWHWQAFLRYAYITHLKHVQVACMVKCSKLGKINMFYLNVKFSELIPPIQYTIVFTM